MNTSTQTAFAVFDVKSKLFSNVHLLQSDGVAIRSFSTACENKDTEFNKFPEDYSLYRLGTFNIETGLLESETPKQICNATEFVNKQ